MNNDAVNNPADQSVTIKATPDTAVFPVAAPSATAVDISPDNHFLSSEIKMDTELFLKGDIKKMADKEKIDATPDPNAPDDHTPNTADQDDGSTDSNYPYLLINRKFAPYSTNTMKN